MLLSSEAGTRLVAQTYLRRPALRPGIARVARQLEPDLQARLASQLHQQALRP